MPRPAWNLTAPKSAVSSALPRASLEGLEVQDSSFDHWLQSGGERRRRPRQEGSASDRGQGFAESELSSGWDMLDDTVLKG